jgi:hypothetical protein
MQLAAIKLTGWKALAVVVLLAGYLGFRYSNRRVTLATAGRDAVRSWIVMEFQRTALGSPRIAPQLDSATAAELLRRSDVEVRSITARGLSDNVVARVEIAVHGATPPDGRSVRYLRLVHSALTGWRVIGESTAMSYYTWRW